jgi:hypothetical protein
MYGVDHLMCGLVTGTAGHRQDGDSSSVVSMHQAVEATPTEEPQKYGKLLESFGKVSFNWPIKRDPWVPAVEKGGCV